MKKYTDGKRTIMATERAFEIIYKEQGFKEFKEQIEEIQEEIKGQGEIKENEEKPSKRNKKK